MAKKIKIKTKKRTSPKDFDIALQYYQSGNLQQAEASCRQILMHQPDNADALHLLGVIACKLKRLDDGIDYFSSAASLMPFNHVFLINLGNAYLAKGMTAAASEAYKRAVSIKPDYAEVYYNLGILAAQTGDLDGAIDNYEKALALKPDYREALNNLGLAFKEKGMLDNALESCKKSLALNPHSAEVFNNLGNVFRDKGMMDEALKNYNAALALKPGLSDTYNNIGTVLTNMGMFEKAIGNFKKALQIEPDDAQKHINMSAAYLLMKDFDKGWEEYEWRLKVIKVAPIIRPRWEGSSIEGKTMLVYPEQGYGDTLQFVRYLPKLYEQYKADRVLFIPQKGLEQLLRDSELKAEILDAETPIEALEFETDIHLLSLPRIFRTNLENMPFKQKRYLKANPEKVRWYSEKFFSARKLESEEVKKSGNEAERKHRGGNDLSLATPAYRTGRCHLPLKIGIFWQGNPELKPDRNRSMPLHYFYPICRMPDVKVYSLQKGYGIEQLNNLPERIEIGNLGETFNDFSDTAAAIENLDLMITVDTAIGHLSGALGKKTWILLPSHAEWRWHLDMDYSPWYEGIKLFRHKEPRKKDWEEMMERVVEEIKKASSG